MKLKKQKQFVVISLLLMIVISFTFFFLGFVNAIHPKLGAFTIQNIEEMENALFLQVSSSRNAILYKVVCYDMEDNIIYEQESESNKIELKDLHLVYNQKVRFIVLAYNNKNEVLESTNDYSYTSLDLSFSEKNEHYMSDASYTVSFDGNMEENIYTLEVYYEDALLSTIDILNTEVILPMDLLKNCFGRVTLKLKKGSRVLESFNIYMNSPIVGNISITNLSVSNQIPWDDLEIKFNGGVNATDLIVNLYNDKNKLENSYQTSYQEGKVVVPAELFKENTSYVLELVASYKDYLEIAKKTQVLIEVGEKETVSPVYVNYNFSNIKKGTQITLTSDTSNATIYYTVDGTEPSEKSFVYANPIQINGDVTIKTKAVRKNMYDSALNVYDFHVGEKELVVYLSPSNQGYNHGASGSGFTTERDMMNKLADILEAYLKDNGVHVYRNNPNTDINTWLSESNYVKSDLHLALHSNGSTSHEAHGIEMYVDNASSKSLSIAHKIYNHLYSIYPNKYQYSNRGVKYSGKSLGEANDSFITCGTLIEIAYHDYYLDALWIVEHMENIAKNIGDSILEYYQVK